MFAALHQGTDNRRVVRIVVTQSATRSETFPTASESACAHLLSMAPSLEASANCRHHRGEARCRGAGRKGAQEHLSPVLAGVVCVRCLRWEKESWATRFAARQPARRRIRMCETPDHKMHLDPSRQVASPKCKLLFCTTGVVLCGHSAPARSWR